MMELRGVLHWNEFEGGFWSLELDEVHEELGTQVVLPDFTPPDGCGDGNPIVVTGEPAHMQVDFLMAGTRFTVTDARAA